MNNILTLSNNGPYLVESNFWGSKCASNGLFYLTWNAGSARLLVPRSMQESLTDMKSADHVVVTRGTMMPEGREAYEMLFEDRSNAPYVLMLGVEQTDRLLPASEVGRHFRFLVYTEAGLSFETEGRYRTARTLPCLAAWANL